MRACVYFFLCFCLAVVWAVWRDRNISGGATNVLCGERGADSD